MSRVRKGQLTEDAYQKTIVASLDRLNSQLTSYKPPVKSHALIEKVSGYWHKQSLLISVCVLHFLT